MNKESKTKFQLPYNSNMELFDKIMNDLKSTTGNVEKLGVLWVNVSASNDVNRSYTFNMGKYLNLVDTDKTNAWLTDLGLQSFKYASGDKRRILLARHMPMEYLAMFKWIKNSEELTTREIKGKFVEVWGMPESNLIFDKAITSFLSYCDYLRIIKYFGKGNASKATITEFGRNVLDSEIEQDGGSKSIPLEKLTETGSIESNKSKILPDGEFPIRILAKGRDFHYDVKTKIDWVVVNSVIASIKEEWELSQKQNTHSEGDGT